MSNYLSIERFLGVEILSWKKKKSFKTSIPPTHTHKQTNTDRQKNEEQKILFNFALILFRQDENTQVKNQF